MFLPTLIKGEEMSILKRVFILLFLFFLSIYTSCSDGNSSLKFSGYMIVEVEGNDRGDLYFMNDELTENQFILHSDKDIVDLHWSKAGKLYGITGIGWYHGQQSFVQFDFTEKKIIEIFSDSEIRSSVLSDYNSKIVYFKNENNGWTYTIKDLNSNSSISFFRDGSENYLTPLCWYDENTIVLSEYAGSLYTYNISTRTLDKKLSSENTIRNYYYPSPDNSKIIIESEFGQEKTILTLYDLSTNEASIVFEDSLQLYAVCWMSDNNRIIFGSDIDWYHYSHEFNKTNVLNLTTGINEVRKDSVIFFPLTAHPLKNVVYGWSRTIDGTVKLDLDTYEYYGYDFGGFLLGEGAPKKVMISPIEVTIDL